MTRSVVFLAIVLTGCNSQPRDAARETVVVTPAKYDGKAELPTVVWLHGWGAKPTSMGMETVFQRLADKHGLAFICVSGTVVAEVGEEDRCAWAEVPEKDYQRIRLAIEEAEAKVRMRSGLIFLGFSQGAVVGIESALRHPETFAGAVSISAGTSSPLHLDEAESKTALPRQGFVIVCGAKESPNSVRRSKELADWLRTKKAEVLQPDYPEHAVHGFPPDFEARLPEWLALIEKTRTGKVR